MRKLVFILIAFIAAANFIRAFDNAIEIHSGGTNSAVIHTGDPPIGGAAQIVVD